MALTREEILRLEVLLKAVTPKLNSKGEHCKSCECYICTQQTLDDYKVRVEAALRGGARPERRDQTIPVRAHFRRSANHLKSKPTMRQFARAMIEAIIVRKEH